MRVADPDLVIVRELRRAGTDFVSGSDLAQTLGISRVAIWQHMEKLRERGFAFEAIRSRGYRLTAQPTQLDALMVRACLPQKDRCHVITLDTVDSTNDEAMRQASQSTPMPLAVISREQTKGRGRLGRDWLSEPNGNLYLSFAFQPQVPPEKLPTITPWVGVNLCSFLADYASVSPQVKWPNDLLIDGFKIGGILTEARLDADRIRDLVIGCGLNLTPPQAGWQGELQGRAVALSELTNQPVDINQFAAALISRLLKACDEFQRSTFTDRLAELWHRYDALRGREITLLHGHEEVTGVGHGIDHEGCLLLEIGGAAPQRFRAGEVTLAKR
jgi:BirA family transcriptional regulator, biotin operon repressor / biotin---[acetyl-CoA-carboxylase] ligase